MNKLLSALITTVSLSISKKIGQLNDDYLKLCKISIDEHAKSSKEGILRKNNITHEFLQAWTE
jgi:hypothetical protein